MYGMTRKRTKRGGKTAKLNIRNCTRYWHRGQTQLCKLRDAEGYDYPGLINTYIRKKGIRKPESMHVSVPVPVSVPVSVPVRDPYIHTFHTYNEFPEKDDLIVVKMTGRKLAGVVLGIHMTTTGKSVTLKDVYYFTTNTVKKVDTIHVINPTDRWGYLNDCPSSIQEEYEIHLFEEQMKNIKRPESFDTEVDKVEVGLDDRGLDDRGLDDSVKRVLDDLKQNRYGGSTKLNRIIR